MVPMLLLESDVAAQVASLPGPAFAQALQISGVAMLAIFAVMAMLGVMIALLQRVFPADESVEEGTQP
jgi:hypothetical protein